MRQTLTKRTNFKSWNIILTDTMLRLQDVWKSYGSIKALEGINIEVDYGHSLCVFGPSGCGKSTLLKLMALITLPDKGSISIDDTEVTKLPLKELEQVRRKNIAYSFQEPLLIPYLNAVENITEVVGVPKEEAVKILGELGLGERLNHRPGKLSVGEKKRVDIARAILRRSKILVADEPLSNLDPETGDKVMSLLRKHVSEGGLLVYSAVDPSESRYADIMLNLKKS